MFVAPSIESEKPFHVPLKCSRVYCSDTDTVRALTIISKYRGRLAELPCQPGGSHPQPRGGRRCIYMGPLLQARGDLPDELVVLVVDAHRAAVAELDARRRLLRVGWVARRPSWSQPREETTATSPALGSARNCELHDSAFRSPPKVISDCHPSEGGDDNKKKLWIIFI